jgi:molybdopterin/thiamine biosynthesis adenylyltransferase
MTQRFARHDLIPDWSQRKLAAATVVISGVGALGNQVATILAMSGVGRLVLCDPDVVDESNLSRTVLFRARDIGRPKVDAAAEALRDLAPETQVSRRPTTFQRGVGLAELREASLVVSGLDSRAARVDLAARCGLVSAPCIDGGTHPWGGEVRLFLKGDGPCYACGLSLAQRAEVDNRQSCAAPRPAVATGASAAASAVVGSWMASAAIRFLMGLSASFHALRIEMSQGSTPVEQRRDSDCPFHVPIVEVSRTDLTASSRVADLRDALGSNAVALLWHPVVRSRTCRTCGFTDQPWRTEISPACPACGRWLLPRTVLEIGEELPEDRTLQELGIPPREILPVRTGGGVRFIELNDHVPTIG